MTHVIHDMDGYQFFIGLDSKPSENTLSADSAHLDYELTDNQTINFTHTFVPFKLRGKGLAEKLVVAGIQWANENNFKIETNCWYVEKYLENHPQ